MLSLVQYCTQHINGWIVNPWFLLLFCSLETKYIQIALEEGEYYYKLDTYFDTHPHIWCGSRVGWCHGQRTSAAGAGGPWWSDWRVFQCHRWVMPCSGCICWDLNRQTDTPIQDPCQKQALMLTNMDLISSINSINYRYTSEENTPNISNIFKWHLVKKNYFTQEMIGTQNHILISTIPHSEQEWKLK